MRVALVTDGIWPYVLGGMQKHSYYICKYLARRGIDVHLFHFNQSSYNIHDLEFFSAEEKKFIHATVLEFPPPQKLPGHYLRRSKQYSKAVYAALLPAIGTFDFIYTKGFTGWHLLKEKKSGNIECAPVGVKFHGYEMFQKPPDLRTWLQHILLLRAPVKKLSRAADVVFSYGGKITRLIRDLGVDPGKIFELPSGVEAETLANEIRRCSNVKKFLFIGRYERRKGIEELNQALMTLTDMDFEMHFVGPIPDSKKIVHPNITYHGELRDREKLLALTRNCDVLLCPSWSEGMPNVILEGMSQGLAVAGTDVGAVNVLVDHNTGWLLDSPRVTLLASTMREVLSLTGEDVDSKKRASLELVRKNFTWEKLVDTLVSGIGSFRNH